MDSFFADMTPEVMMKFMTAGMSEEKKQKIISEIEGVMDRSLSDHKSLH